MDARNKRQSQVEKFVETRDKILAKPMLNETRRMKADEPNKKIDLKKDEKGEWFIYIDDDKYPISTQVADLFFDMLAGNRLLTKTNEELKLVINKHKIMSKPEGVHIIKPNQMRKL